MCFIRTFSGSSVHAQRDHNGKAADEYMNLEIMILPCRWSLGPRTCIFLKRIFEAHFLFFSFFCAFIWPGPTTCGICYPTRDWTQVPYFVHTESYHWIPGKLLDLHFSFILLLTSSVTLGKIFSFTEWFLYHLLKWCWKYHLFWISENWRRVCAQMLEIKSRRSCRRVGESLPLRKHEKKKEKYVLIQRELFQRPTQHKNRLKMATQ